MKLITTLAAVCLAVPAMGQGLRYDHRVATIATNYPAGAQVPVMAIPNAQVTICVDGNCGTKALIYSNQTLTVPTSNPMQADGQGNFGFWVAAGTYFYKVVEPSGKVNGIHPITLGGAGGTGPVVQVNGTPLITQSPVNFENAGGVTFTNPSAGIIHAAAAGGGTGCTLGGIPTNAVLSTNGTLCKGDQFFTYHSGVVDINGGASLLMETGSNAEVDGVNDPTHNNWLWTGDHLSEVSNGADNFLGGIQLNINDGSCTTCTVGPIPFLANYIEARAGKSALGMQLSGHVQPGIAAGRITGIEVDGPDNQGGSATTVWGYLASMHADSLATVEQFSFLAETPTSTPNANYCDFLGRVNAGATRESIGCGPTGANTFNGPSTFQNITINGTCTGTGCGSGGGAVSSVSNSDGTLTVTPTTGAAVASLNLAHANTWTAPISVNDGTGVGGTFNATEGTAATAVASHQILNANASTHTLNLSSNGGAFSPICTAANGQCAGGTPFITSLTTTGSSGPATVSGGALNIPVYTGGGTSILGPLQVPNLFASVNPPSTLSPLTVQANDVFDSNTAFFSDGTAYNTAGANYASSGNFIADQMFACIPNPGKCSSTLLLNLLTKYVAAVNGAGQMPINLSSSITPLYYSAFDFHHAFASLDGTAFAPQMLYLYCQKFGLGSSQCSSAYTAAVAVIKSSWAALPRNGTTQLFTVVAGNEYLCATGFQEYVRNTGDVSNCNVWYASDMANMAAIATAQGDTANATFFNSERSTVVAAIRANLINGTTGLLISATLQNSANDDIPSSALAVACDLMPTVMASCGILTSGQKTTIENYFNTNYATLVNANGYVLQTPRSGGWAFFGCIQAGGGGPYSSGCPGFGATQYQGGSWSYFSEFFALALGQVNPAKVAVFLNTNLNPVSGDPAMEWNDQGSTSLPGAASTNYMASVGWAVAANNAFPLAPTITAGPGCVNKYGAQVNSGCSAGGIPNPLSVPTQLVFNGGSNNQIINYTSVSASNTAVFMTNTSTGGHSWADLVQGSVASNVGERCWLDVTAGVVTFCTSPTKFHFDSAAVLGWSSGGAAATATDTGFSRDSAGVVDLGNGTAGNKSGSLNLTNLTVTGTCTGCGGGGGSSFSAITGGTNTTAAMVVGAGGSLNFTSTGTINASTLGGATFAAPGAIGGTTPSTAVFSGTNSLTSTGISTFKNGSSNNAVQIGSGTFIALGSDAYIQASASGVANAGFFASRPTTSRTVSLDLVTGADPSTGWSMQMPSGGGTDWDLLDRANSVKKIACFVGGTCAFNPSVTSPGYLVNGTTFTASGCSNTTLVGGSTAGSFHSGTTGACTVTVTMGMSLTTTNGWSCNVHDITTPTDVIGISATTTTTVTFTGNTTTGDVINFDCTGY